MKIHVRCSGRHGREVPRTFLLGARLLRVLRVNKSWEEGGCRHFSVRVVDGRDFVLGQDPATGDWELERAAS